MSDGANNYLMIGPQGSGKGTQADLLAKKLGIPHISTGDIFREMRAEDSELGRKVKALIDNGNLVPDEITNQIVAERLKRDDAKNGFLLDGFPRNIAQAGFLEGQADIAKCILIDISDQESIKRISARRVCPVCKTNYNTIYQKPRKDGICDNCQSELSIRDDDKPASVVVRLKKYHHETEPILDFYQDKGVLVKINGEQLIDAVFKDILAALKIG